MKYQDLVRGLKYFDGLTYDLEDDLIINPVHFPNHSSSNAKKQKYHRAFLEKMFTQKENATIDIAAARQKINQLAGAYDNPVLFSLNSEVVFLQKLAALPKNTIDCPYIREKLNKLDMVADKNLLLLRNIFIIAAKNAITQDPKEFYKNGNLNDPKEETKNLLAIFKSLKLTDQEINNANARVIPKDFPNDYSELLKQWNIQIQSMEAKKVITNNNPLLKEGKQIMSDKELEAHRKKIQNNKENGQDDAEFRALLEQIALDPGIDQEEIIKQFLQEQEDPELAAAIRLSNTISAVNEKEENKENGQDDAEFRALLEQIALDPGIDQEEIIKQFRQEQEDAELAEGIRLSCLNPVQPIVHMYQQQQILNQPAQNPVAPQPQIVQQPAPAPAPRPTSGIDRINGRRR